MKQSKNIKLVLGVLNDEIRGDVKSTLKKLASDYKMTWVYQTKKGKLFPATKKDTETTSPIREVILVPSLVTAIYLFLLPRTHTFYKL